MSDVSYRVFIEKSELQRLRNIEKLYYSSKKAKENNAISTSGEGAAEPIAAGGDAGNQSCIQNHHVLVQNTEQSDQRNGSLSPVEIVLPSSSKAPLTQVAEISDSRNISQLSPDAIVSSIWKRFQKKARILLTEIRLNPNITYNSKGEVTIDGKFHQNSDIRLLLSVCFYSIEENKQIVALGPFITFLKENGLFQSITNSRILISDTKYAWYYIGHLV